jgi:phosphoribosylformylglycinamidine synthase
MKNFIVNVTINLKKSIQDPQGTVVKSALNSLGYASVNEVRMGKHVTIHLNSENKEQANNSVDKMCRKMLSNPVIETYKFSIEEVL